MKVNVERILVLVFGATTGATLHEFKVNGGVSLLWKKDIPWIMEGSVYVWPMDWLTNLLAEVKEMATPGTIITSAMWGADVVHMNGDRIIGNVLHYRSSTPEYADTMMSEIHVPKFEWSRLMGNVQAEFYQMVFISAFWRQQSQNVSPACVVPLADWITAQLSGQYGHDPVMLHNQGAGVSTSSIVNCIFGYTRFNEFAPKWKIFAVDELLPLPNNAYVIPCTHDSAFARSVLASTGLTWGLWTGSWYGVFRQVTLNDKITPSEKTYDAGLVFEAMPDNSLSAISNIGMHGPRYKALKDFKRKRTYEEASGIALNALDQAVGSGKIFSDEVLKQEPEVFAKSAYDLSGHDMALALATMVNTIALGCKSGLLKAAEALELPMPNNVAIVGGFAENPAILTALEMHGIKAAVPPFAGLATQAGAAANALCRAGVATTTEEALQMLSNT